MIFILDTSALVEYLRGSDLGAKVNDIFKTASNSIIIPSIVIAELSSKLSREGKDASIIHNLLSLRDIRIINFLPTDIAIAAGHEHAVLKKTEKKISLIDVIIIKLAENLSANILTMDHHFRHYNRTILLEK